MSKAVLISINPKWCELIASGKKTIEIRKTKPKLETPFKVYIYCTRPRNFFKISPAMYSSEEYLHLCDGKVSMGDGFDLYDKEYEVLNCKVIGEFVCDEIRNYYPIDIKDPINKPYGEEIEKESCLSTKQVNDYGFRTLGYGMLFGWHITDLVIYDEPKELSCFCKPVECHRGLQKEGCVGCWDCEIKRPPQSWCYVQEV